MTDHIFVIIYTTITRIKFITGKNKSIATSHSEYCSESPPSQEFENVIILLQSVTVTDAVNQEIVTGEREGVGIPGINKLSRG